jgi:hypothetical protein
VALLLTCTTPPFELYEPGKRSLTLIILQLSAPRFAKYWKKRYEILGADNAFRPLTLKNPAFQGEGMDAWFKTAQVQLIRRTGHRDFLYIDAAKADPTLYSRECALKGILYVLHALLEDEDVQRKGLIAISNSDGVSQRNRDTLLTKALIELSQGAFPIRLSAVHCCNLPTIFNVIMRFFLALIGDRLRKRIIVHCEMGPELLTKLVNDFGFQLADLPTQMGGERTTDFRKWIEERSQQCL